jgi:hypothetical protein
MNSENALSGEARATHCLENPHLLAVILLSEQPVAIYLAREPSQAARRCGAVL